MTPFILLAIGLLLIFFEFYLPGGVMGTLGGLVVFASMIVFAIQSDSIIETFFFILGSCTAFVLLVKFALWRIQHAAPGTSIYSNADQEGYVADKYDETTIGKIGTVSTDLRPSGHIIIEGKRYTAVSQGGYISKGSEVTVLSGQGKTLIVKLFKKESAS